MTHRVTIRSVGRAPHHAFRVLHEALDVPMIEAVQRIYQAPAALLSGLGPAEADTVAGMLRDLGMDALGEPEDVPLTPGEGRYDVALHLADPTRLPEIAAAIVHFLGCTPQIAIQTILAAPCLLVGRVSAATVDALRARFEPLGAEVDVADRTSTIYDVIALDPPVAVRARVEALLRAEGVPPAAGPVLALGIPPALAERVWATVDRARANFHLVARDHERFDVELTAGTDTPALRAALAQVGMPERVIPRALRRLPLVLAPAVRAADAERLLATVSAAGGVARAELVTFASFQVTLEGGSDVPAIVAALTTVGLAPRTARLQLPLALGTFPRPRALWIRSQLAAVGATVRLDRPSP